MKCLARSVTFRSAGVPVYSSSVVYPSKVPCFIKIKNRSDDQRLGLRTGTMFLDFSTGVARDWDCRLKDWAN